MYTIRAFFYPAIYPHYEGYQRNSIIHDTITAVALSVLSLVLADACEREAPGLALLFRAIPFGVSLLWLYNRAIESNGRYPGVAHYHHAPQPHPDRFGYLTFNYWFPHRPYHPPMGHPVPPPPLYRSPQRARHLHPAPVQRGFPYVQPAPAQPHMGFPYVQPAPAQPHRGFPHHVQPAPAQPQFRVNPMPAQTKPFSFGGPSSFGASRGFPSGGLGTPFTRPQDRQLFPAAEHH